MRLQPRGVLDQSSFPDSDVISFDNWSVEPGKSYVSAFNAGGIMPPFYHLTSLAKTVPDWRFSPSRRKLIIIKKLDLMKNSVIVVPIINKKKSRDHAASNGCTSFMD
ncbi:hypothetical protein [Paenibacillus dokdonensis]|uniref:hypothetical protein n=1 Tax=Paenibacillus dokdonensis TaxID=2567944 RepID=UPI003D265255